MLLRDWMKQKKMTIKDFAKLMGWGITKAWEVAYNNKDIKLSEAMKIEEKTKGNVRPKDIIQALIEARG